MTRAEPTAAIILETVDRELTAGRTAPTVRRYRHARWVLESFLDVAAPAYLTDSGRSMLELERALEPDGAVLRVATAEDLLYMLPAFVSAGRDGLSVPQTRAQLRFADLTIRCIEQHRLVDRSEHQCALWELEGALHRAKATLRGR